MNFFLTKIYCRTQLARNGISDPTDVHLQEILGSSHLGALICTYSTYMHVIKGHLAVLPFYIVLSIMSQEI